MKTGKKLINVWIIIASLIGGDVGTMNNINGRHFRIRRAIKNKGFYKLSIISLLAILLLCSCNKKDEKNNREIYDWLMI